MTTTMQIPKVITLRLVTEPEARPVAGVALVLKICVPHKNHYAVGPKFTGPDGLVSFERSNIEKEIALCRRTSPMDYAGEVSDCERLELKVMSSADIQRMIDARALWGIGVPEWKLSTSQLASLRAAQGKSTVTNSVTFRLNESSLGEEILLQLESPPVGHTDSAR